MKTLIIFVILSLAGCAHACSCINRSPTEKFCKADFAVLVKVLDNGNTMGMDRRYGIQLKATFRSNAYGWVYKQFMYTATDSAACGITLEQGKYYILTGYYQNRRMRTGLCDRRMKFNTNPLPIYTPPNCRGIYFPGQTLPISGRA